MRSISIAQDRSNDNISVYENSAIFVVTLDRTDLDKLKKLDHAKKAGIYILLGDIKRYVGQGTRQPESLNKRILEHKESWFNKIIFFDRKDNEFTRAQADLLEAELITNTL